MATALKRSCGKVMLLQVSVILFTGGGAGPGGVPGPGGVCFQGVPGPRGVPAPGGLVLVPGEDPPETRPLRTATAAGGMHPTGMHSSLF